MPYYSAAGKSSNGGTMNGHVSSTKGPGVSSSASTTENTVPSHAVSRSSEFLSCARTALKIAKSDYRKKLSNNNSDGGTQKQPKAPWYISLETSQLKLVSMEPSPSSLDNNTMALLEDGIAFLRSMDQALIKLKSLVRQRGHTNDPATEIGIQTQTLKSDTQEFNLVVESIQKISQKQRYKQHQRHLQLVSQWLQSMASQQTKALEQILQVRGKVLADQVQRRQLLQPGAVSPAGTTNGISTTATASRPAVRKSLQPPKRQIPTALNSPFFTATNSQYNTNVVNRRGEATTATAGATGSTGNTMKPPMAANGVRPIYQKSKPPSSGVRTTTTTNHNSATAARSGYSYYGGYGNASIASAGGGYGGIAASSNSMGTRQRRGGGNTPAPSPYANNNGDNKEEDVDDVKKQQALLQMRMQDRQTQNRLEAARQAESTLANLGKVFGKMSSLISQQGEILEKIEDDVEAAHGYVEAGAKEIQVLYSIKKGNRSLIIKVFGILIFLIIFMRFY